MYYHTVKEFKVDQFDVIVDWTYEFSSLEACFDDTVSDIAEMKRRCEMGLDTHYIARVRFMYRGVEMGSSSLGSCYAYDCDPEDDINNGIYGYLEGMMERAEREARERAVEMLDRLKADFLS